MILDDRIDMRKLPKHIGIIMDGNGRWAKQKNKPRLLGHKAGVEALRGIIQSSSDIGIEILTIYAFSTENWRRPKSEVDGLMRLLIEYFNKEIKALNKNRVKINVLGNINLLPLKTKESVEKAMNTTATNTGLILNIAINYGGRDEIIAAVKKLSKDVVHGIYQLDDINEDVFSSYLYTAGLSDPDLIIRTSGELRLSNFLIWQCAYSELWFTDVLWPDFYEKDFFQAIYDYQQRKRKYGGLNS
ncbi:MAG: isoprenyl transferase [Eubacteriales bacterium]